MGFHLAFSYIYHICISITAEFKVGALQSVIITSMLVYEQAEANSMQHVTNCMLLFVTEPGGMPNVKDQAY